jgi:hypothetical protein
MFASPQRAAGFVFALAQQRILFTCLRLTARRELIKK